MKNSRRWGVLVTLVCAALVLVAVGAAPSLAQTFRGSILGTVTDSTGATIINAKVTVHNVDTGVERVTETNADGQYLVP
ncbi:MAG TPA: carboxypeptidase-like regulatory domain-containing protein, partial [Candidatus Acidoferrales bacterium]